ncbi:MAG: DUF3365 domain-containing protein [Desulfuromonadales bacterium]|nr:DUF3365 domain-containing protein [Desulfuromonadales bacterium]
MSFSARNFQSSTTRCALWSIAFAGWTILILLLAWYQHSTDRRAFLDIASAEARASYDKDLLYRRWAARHGGVYVPVTEETPPSPYLKNIPERDIVTPSGKKLTLINPAYMTRQVFILAGEAAGVRGHITSLNPIRPENRPDPWEKETLRRFAAGAPHASTVAEIDGQQFLREMFPMVTEASCLKCHQQQGHAVGQIRGGISVSVPLAPYREVSETVAQQHFITYLVIWVVGMLFLFTTRKKIELQIGQVSAALAHARQVQGELQISAANYRILFDEAAYGIAVADIKTGELLAVNAALCQLVERDKDALLGKSQAILHPPELKAPGAVDVSRCFEDYRAGLSSDLHVSRIITRTGQLRDVEIKAARVVYNGHEALQGLFYDMTERTSLQHQAIRTSHLAAIGELSAGVAHEINNPISGVINYADILKSRTTDAKSRELLERIIKEGERVATIVKNLLSFSRDDKGEHKFHDIEVLFEEALSLVSLQLKKDGITLQTSLAADLGQIKCNAHQIEQVLLNLLSNSRYALNEKFPDHDDNKKIVLSARRTEKDHHALLSIKVTDFGSGIPQQVLPNVLKSFYTTKKPGVGTGLGLSICADIIRLHQGTIAIDSVAGEYTRVSIDLPLMS